MLEKVIRQLDPAIYAELKEELVSTRGEKMLQLLELYRNGTPEPEVTPKKLALTNAAFYTLRSRLQDKVQKALFENASDDYADILKNLASVPFLVNNSPREVAVMLLLFLEEELKRKDQPGELAQVYGALKKLHAYHKDYFHYEQLYNKNIAYFLAFEKAEEVLTHFTRVCGDYLMSFDRQHLEVLKLYIKELNNLSRIYDSHRIKVCRYIAEITYAQFIDPEKNIPGSDLTISELLEEMHAILETHQDDQRYRFIRDIWHFLNYEYYCGLGLHKNARPSFEFVAGNQLRVLLRAHTAIGSHLLLSAFHLFSATDNIDVIAANLPEIDSNDQYSMCNYALFNASLSFQNGKYAEAASVLNEFLNETSLKNSFVAEYNVKLLLVLCLLCAGKTDSAEVQFRSVSRKIASIEDKRLLQEGVAEWVQVIKVCMGNGGDKKNDKLKIAISNLNLARKKPGSLLFHLRIPEDMVKHL